MYIGLDNAIFRDGVFIYRLKLMISPVKLLAADGADMPMAGLIAVPAVLVRHMDMLGHVAGAGEDKLDVAVPVAPHALIEEGIVKGIAVVPLVGIGVGIAAIAAQQLQSAVILKRLLHGGGDAGDDKGGDAAGDIPVGAVALHPGQLLLGVFQLQLQLLDGHILFPHLQLGEGSIIGEEHVPLFDLLTLVDQDFIHALGGGEVDLLHALHRHLAVGMTGVAPVIGHGKALADVIDLDLFPRPVPPGINPAKGAAAHNEQGQHNGNNAFFQIHSAPPVWIRPSRMR